MQARKHLSKIITLSMMGVITLTACGGDSKKATTTPTTTTNSATIKTTPPPSTTNSTTKPPTSSQTNKVTSKATPKATPKATKSSTSKSTLKSTNGAKYYTSTPRTTYKYREVPTSTPVTGRPTSITISSIGVRNATMLSRGLSNGVLSPPPGYVQWYTGTVKPGDNGISVLAGHVTYYGADVLYNLGRTPIGSKINIKYSNGMSKTFTVKRKSTINKNTLRYDQTVWGASSTPKLVIITCDKYSRWAGRHHVDNYVVWAE